MVIQIEIIECKIKCEVQLLSHTSIISSAVDHVSIEATKRDTRIQHISRVAGGREMDSVRGFVNGLCSLWVRGCLKGLRSLLSPAAHFIHPWLLLEGT